MDAGDDDDGHNIITDAKCRSNWFFNSSFYTLLLHKIDIFKENKYQ